MCQSETTITNLEMCQSETTITNLDALTENRVWHYSKRSDNQATSSLYECYYSYFKTIISSRHNVKGTQSCQEMTLFDLGIY